MSPLAFTLARYAAAVSATAIALALRAAATPLWGVALPFIFFYPAIMLSAWLGWFGPGVVTTFLCAAAAVSPSLSPGSGLRADNLADATALLVFMGNGLLISGLTGALRLARARLAAQVRELEADTEALEHGEMAQARLAAIVQSSDDAIVSKTLDGEIMSWNAAATRMFGYAPEEVIGRSITIIIPKDRLNEEAHTLASIRQGKAIEHFRTVRLRKDQTPILISLTVSPIRNATGQIIGASKIARDITAQVEGEGDREILLARERAARREAESANRAKDEFLAMLGHELRNPLGAISNAAHVLERLGQPGDATAAIRGIIGRQTAHLARLTDDLLDIGRVMVGKVVLDMKPVDLREVAERAIGGLREGGRIERHTVSFDGAPAWVDADTTRIEQIVTNLVTNALKYTPPGGSIKVRVTRKGRDAALSVEDDGLGIAPELLPRIFDLFVQGQPPAGEAEDRDAPAEAARRILIVEDNDDAREMLRTLLELRRHTVREAIDGPSGIQAALQFQPDIALIDVGLPGLDGYEVARRLRASEGAKRMRLIALTGYGLPADALRAREAGFDAHFVKPVHPDQLAEILGSEPDA